MISRHIHIKGRVQGVGFRPAVYRLAKDMGLGGTVCNSTDGVHISLTGTESQLDRFLAQLLQAPPPNAVITHYAVTDIPLESFPDFRIAVSTNPGTPDLMLTPDLGICDNCRQELSDPANRRYHYPFTTCLHCGPRYSIMQALPYDREQTTMRAFAQCPACQQEYNDPANRRHYSQTNSCPVCSIPMNLFSSGGQWLASETETIISQVTAAWHRGEIVAVKGIGGFLLMCDAGNAGTVALLRQRKQRPAKPLALLYPNLASLEADTELCQAERNLLQDLRAPIVLCSLRPHPKHALPLDLIAPGLHRIGAMLPYAPLLELLAQSFGHPLVATSANISGCPIIYENEVALRELPSVADFILVHDRDIVAPQDDSVIQLTEARKIPILLRRSRGWAPQFYPCTLPPAEETILATGAELKSSFALQHQDKCYISQFLGDQAYLEAQESYRHTLDQLCSLLHCHPSLMLADSHPGYEVSRNGRQMAEQTGVPCVNVQHHEAHAAAVLAEHGVLQARFPILTLAWDGTGYGHDGHIWGSEAFVYQQGHFERVGHLDYFPVLLGDKMSREPRLSALALAHSVPEAMDLLKPKFTEAEWDYYRKLLPQAATLTSSMGRLLDGIASMLGLIDLSRYEGEAAMRLQSCAEDAGEMPKLPYPIPWEEGIIHWQPMITGILHDLGRNIPAAVIAARVHHTLEKLPYTMAESLSIRHLAFSGGVMQNALLIDGIADNAGEKYRAFFHQQLSPNDECISFGQLAWFAAQQIKNQHHFAGEITADSKSQLTHIHTP